MKASIEAARAADILTVALRTGAQLKRVAAAEWAGPCPFCGGTDRFSTNTKRQLFNCRGFGGGDTIDMVQHVLGLSFVEAAGFITGEERHVTRRDPPRQPTSDDPASRKASVERDLASAKRIVAQSIPLRGTPGELYLRQLRKIDTGPIEDVLRRTDAIAWNSAVYYNNEGHALHAQRLGCIIGVMSDAMTGKPTGAISRTYLASDLTKVGKAKTLGSPLGVVRLSRDQDVLEGLFLAEGLETTIAAMSIGLRPIWSTGSASSMAKFPVLSGVEALTVVVDHDLDGRGERAAREVEARWRGQKREVNLLRRAVRGDFNDALAEIVQ
jgi:hypothetical protein